jgi:hypothetical protein
VAAIGNFPKGWESWPRSRYHQDDPDESAQSG